MYFVLLKFKNYGNFHRTVRYICDFWLLLSYVRLKHLPLGHGSELLKAVFYIILPLLLVNFNFSSDFWFQTPWLLSKADYTTLSLSDVYLWVNSPGRKNCLIRVLYYCFLISFKSSNIFKELASLSCHNLAVSYWISTISLEN